MKDSERAREVKKMFNWHANENMCVQTIVSSASNRQTRTMKQPSPDEQSHERKGDISQFIAHLDGCEWFYAGGAEEAA